MKILPVRLHVLIVVSCFVVGWGCATAFAADTPIARGRQAPGYYRMCIGNFEVTALYDGFVDINPDVLQGANQNDIHAALTKEFAPLHPTGIRVSINAFLIRTESNFILVDTGAGTAFGTTAGELQGSIQEAGYNPSEINAILITHMHVDHFAGLVTPDGKVAFPNATVYLSQIEADDSLKDSQYDLPLHALTPYKEEGRLKPFIWGKTVLPHVRAVNEMGHTPGMAGYLFDTGAEPLLLWGDLIHVLSVQFSHPEISIEFDEDHLTTIEIRRQMMDRAATGRFLIGSPHLPFPGLGHIVKMKKGYRWIPVEYAPACGHTEK